jgi:MoaA/NifB/PqqE/SkfB family radical SAM enzyme
MKLSGLHFLLTYQCTFACDHCFVWGSPWQQGTMTLENIQNFLQQAKDTQSIKNIAFEGGEPFLYYGTLLQAVKMAAEMGFRVGIVSNAYWATSPQDALVWLTPFQGLIDGLTVSSDLYHYDEQLSRQAQSAQSAASELGISTIGLISVAQPEEINATRHVGQLPNGAGAVMYRGRAADKLAPRAEKMPWEGPRRIDMPLSGSTC